MKKEAEIKYRAEGRKNREVFEAYTIIKNSMHKKWLLCMPET